jgi:hypothetical protein
LIAKLIFWTEQQTVVLFELRKFHNFVSIIDIENYSGRKQYGRIQYYNNTTGVTFIDVTFKTQWLMLFTVTSLYSVNSLKPSAWANFKNSLGQESYGSLIREALNWRKTLHFTIEK